MNHFFTCSKRRARKGYINEFLQPGRQFHQESGQKIFDQAQDYIRTIDPDVADSSEFHLETKLPPEDYVESFVKEVGADLVVLGCYGHHLGVKQLTGTVAMRIMNAAPCKVLFVR